MPPFPPPPPEGATVELARIPRPRTGRVYQSSPHREPPTLNLPDNATENSGSLTGLVLSRGRVDVPGPRSHLVVVLVVLLLVVAMMVIIGLFAAAATGDAVTSFFDRVLNR